jgi:murein DD-endopeptidase MepM/ murein hydrolase activator NlpD
VGASGTVSGPHLDYRIKHHGKYINPLAARFDPVEPLREEFREEFLAQAQYYRVAFDAPWIVYAALARTSLFASQVEIGD